MSRFLDERDQRVVVEVGPLEVRRVARAGDLDVNACREKHLTNVRSSTADVLVRLVPHRKLSLDQAMEFLREDECVEVTPAVVRLRKVLLDQTERTKAGRRARATATP